MSRVSFTRPTKLNASLQFYKWQGVMNAWHTPANTGRYEVRMQCSCALLSPTNNTSPFSS